MDFSPETAGLYAAVAALASAVAYLWQWFASIFKDLRQQMSTLEQLNRDCLEDRAKIWESIAMNSRRIKRDEDDAVDKHAK